MWFLMLLYNLISLPLFPVYMILLIYKALRREESLRERFKIFKGPLKGAFANDIIWIHAASVGEVKAVTALLEELKLDQASPTLLISTITRTGQREAQRLVGQENTFYFPFDFLPLLLPLLGRLKGGKLLLVETEIWPNLIYFARKMGIKTYLVNGRLSSKRFPRYQRYGFFFAKLLRYMEAIMVQSKADYGRFVELGVRKSSLYYTGNLKLDNLTLPRSRELAPELVNYLNPSQGPLLIAGSTHEGEEEIFLKSLPIWQEEWPNLRLILAPRHLERSEELIGLGQKYGLRVQRRTALKESPPRANVLILDTLGELAQVYPFARLVFIGGSLLPRGGHNPLEALGKPLFFGPFMDNCRELADLLLKEKLAQEVKDEGDLLEKIRVSLRRDGGGLANLEKKATQFLKEHAGAVDRVLTIIGGK